jgi:hypothetical protein
MSVMWYGGPLRALGAPVDAHGSGGPGRGAFGSKGSVVIDSSVSAEDRAFATSARGAEAFCDAPFPS